MYEHSGATTVERVTIWHMATRKRLDIAEIGRRIAQRRDDLGLDQQALADAAKVSRPYISRLERGQKTKGQGFGVNSWPSAL